MTHYIAQVEGHLAPRLALALEGFTLIHQVTPEGRPVSLIAGMVEDQAALYGLISRLRDLGLALISLQPQGAGPVEES